MNSGDVKIGSLFSGLGGLDLACEQFFDATTAWQVEYDAACQSVLERHWPTSTRYGDVTTLDFADVEPVDILCGGYPCQPFSQAGKRAGEDDARHLWPHYARAISDLRPRIAVLENVLGHLSLGFDRVLGDLAEIGYDARWTVVRASDVGACHRRGRLFCVAYAAPSVVDMGRGKTVTEWTEWTEKMKAGHANGNGHGRSLDIEARRLLPTPNAHDERSWSYRRREDSQASKSIASMARQADTDWGRYADAIARHERALGRPAPEPCDEKRRLSPEFVEFMMMLPDQWTHGTRAQRLKMLGNAVVPAQAVHALGLLAGLDTAR